VTWVLRLLGSGGVLAKSDEVNIPNHPIGQTISVLVEGIPFLVKDVSILVDEVPIFVDKVPLLVVFPWSCRSSCIQILDVRQRTEHP